MLDKHFERNAKKVNLAENTKKRIRFVWRIATSLLLIVTGVLFMASCYSIYKSGDSPFTRDSISASFSKIAVLTYVTIFAVIGGAVIEISFPPEKKKLTGKRTDLLVMKSLYAKTNISALADDIRLSIEREEKLRHVMRIIVIVLFIFSGFLPLIYLLNPNNFPAIAGEYNSEILRGMLFYLACLTPVFVYEIVYVIACDKSIIRETEKLKEAIKENGISDCKSTDKNEGVFRKIAVFVNNNEKSLILGVRIAFVGCAIGFIIAGIFNGGMNNLLNKAINICTECIGLG